MSRGVFRCLIMAATMGVTASEGMAQGYDYDPFPSMRAYKWSGFYAGFQGGYSLAQTSADSGPFPGVYTQSYSLTSTGLFGGAHFGYNYQFGHYLLGAEVDLEAANYSSHNAGSLGSMRETHLDWQSSIRGRLGWTSGPWLAYGTAGVVFARGGTSLPAASFTDKYTGWTVGLGLERAVTQSATLRLEYRYTDFGRTTYANTATNTQDSSTLTNNALRAGISFRF